ncbi:hypothetical protein [Nocardia transvalensis]|uniref:hypothetical protein n=1 Tax=Nocardia transvalensis TaxID=37333 RepID=UPI0012F6AAD5|nr:hypothetical protein [Nocardia transvalensis]
MSRNNELPMLPPWLSESEVTQSGYEAPVQNLPHQELIPEQGSLKKRAKRKSDDKDKDKADPDSGKKRRTWRKDKSDQQDQQPPSSWGTPPMPDAVPAQGDPSYRTPESFRPDGGFQPEPPQRPGGDHWDAQGRGAVADPRPSTGFPPQQDPRAPYPDAPPPAPAPTHRHRTPGKTDRPKARARTHHPLTLGKTGHPKAPTPKLCRKARAPTHRHRTPGRAGRPKARSRTDRFKGRVRTRRPTLGKTGHPEAPTPKLCPKARARTHRR